MKKNIYFLQLGTQSFKAREGSKFHQISIINTSILREIIELSTTFFSGIEKFIFFFLMDSEI